jgi:hypothetical protein
LAAVGEQPEIGQLPRQPPHLLVAVDLAAQLGVLLSQRVRAVLVAVRMRQRRGRAADRPADSGDRALDATGDRVQQPPHTARGVRRPVVDRDQAEREDE